MLLKRGWIVDREIERAKGVKSEQSIEQSGVQICQSYRWKLPQPKTVRGDALKDRFVIRRQRTAGRRGRGAGTSVSGKRSVSICRAILVASFAEYMYQHFGEKYWLHLQGRTGFFLAEWGGTNISEKNASSILGSNYSCFCRKEEGSIFLRNGGSSLRDYNRMLMCHETNEG
jgi:hypothetical protein